MSTISHELDEFQTWLSRIGTATSIVGCATGDLVACGLAVAGILTDPAYLVPAANAQMTEEYFNRQRDRSILAFLRILSGTDTTICYQAPSVTPAYYCCTYSVVSGNYCTCGGCGTPDSFDSKASVGPPPEES